MQITYCFDEDGGFIAKSVSDAGVLIEYAYPTSEYATKAKKNPQLIAACMVGDTTYLAVYQTRPWFAEHIAHLTAKMDAVLSA